MNRMTFASDNTAGMCPEAMEAVIEANAGTCPSYGEDPWTRKAADGLRELFETDCDVYFVCTGTAANSLALASLCSSYESVICHELAHIETDECGAPEFFSNGSKLLTVPGELGKMDPQGFLERVERRKDIHYPRPRVLSLSQATEAGTVYTPEEISGLTSSARSHGMQVHMDGARFFNACVRLGTSPANLTWKAGVDVLCLSGTKNGLGVGEAVIFFHQEQADIFAYRCKQSGQLLSKMRFFSAPWLGLLQGETWKRNAEHANRMADRLRAGFAQIEGVTLSIPTEANGVFAHLPSGVAEALKAKEWGFYTFIGEGFARFLCSWATREEEVEHLLADVRDAVHSV